MHILAAFDKFKDAMPADCACDAALSGARAALGDQHTFTRAPLTDGGEGFCPILTQAANGYMEHHTVCGPLGEEVEAPLGWVAIEAIPASARQFLAVKTGQLAIIEMASVAGLEQVPHAQRHPKHCTTRGVGDLIRIAVAEEASAILLGIGGSATSDLGLGALESLGLKFCPSGQITPAQWDEIQQITGQIDIEVPPIYIACDVDNPLLGPQGAAAIYGPQKGLSPDAIEAFDDASERVAKQLCQFFKQDNSRLKVPGSGAAGGLGFGLNVAFGASYVPGFELVTAWLDLANKIKHADLVLTGEGKFDQSSLAGKGPYALLAAAYSSDTAAILLAGLAEDDAAQSVRERFPGTAVYSITPAGTPLPEALKGAAQFLTQKVTEVLQTQYRNDG
ncbi:glycerate kinase [Coraliomargarita sp. SDUM461004]|uniref:Glycerate kinase n=1 Tax=Thalassobacterium sedimentorum TaxID=3041258 RepID=A0ABU1AIR2_9BACT|nr:glycerate kinase [Coraliomargarita sp. SDUM461004]MDQ8194709.1 glycerate kinase [Coraliomargarita sp. SDUM461004]